MAGLFIEHGADVSRQTDEGMTIFHLAAAKGHVQLLRAALERLDSPAILNFQDNGSDGTALHYVIAMLRRGPSERTLVLTSMLLEAGADVNVQDSDGESALMIAARQGNDKLVRLLLEAGANVKDQCHSGQSALSYAAGHGHNTVVGLLLEWVAPNHQDNSYLTLALGEAVKGNHRDVVKQVISFGADSSIKEVLSLALESSTSEVVHILVEAGARFNLVLPHAVARLFAARDAGEYVPGIVEVAAKCEALLADPETRALYYW